MENYVSRFTSTLGIELYSAFFRVVNRKPVDAEILELFIHFPTTLTQDHEMTDCPHLTLP